MHAKMHNGIAIVFMIAAAATVSAFIILLSTGWPTFAATEEAKFWAGLEGEFEEPQVETVASGMAVFKDMQDRIWYMINVTSIDKVTAARIHSGGQGENGPIVVWLFKSDFPTENLNGTLAQGNITADMLEGPFLGKQLSELGLEMQNNATYVNIHTTDHPDGEIRGQIMFADLTHAEIMMN
jgi:CHRD domain